ncbi:GNAT family N-acetyltransferase [Halomicronema hongdechloris]|nr:GNAT family N-acetyltransferase [Halomicronema hongdechloris]
MLRVGLVDYYAFKAIIHQIRTEVFVYEQRVPPELEIDAFDPLATHALAWWHEHPVGTGRLLPTGYIGRVAVSRPLRRRGIGKAIMETLMMAAATDNHRQIIVSAQCHAIAFYRKLGFQEEGPIYQEAGIPHIKMVKHLI